MELLQTLADWKRTPRADGADLAGEAGTIAIRDGVHPAPSLSALVETEAGGEIVKIPEGTTADAGLDQTFRFEIRPDGGATVASDLRWRGDPGPMAPSMFSVTGAPSTAGVP